MPRLSRIFVWASLVYLGLGFTLGGLVLANKGISFLPVIWSVLPIHIEFLFIGWFVQFVFGVAYWILPRISGEMPRGNEMAAWISLVTLNFGLWSAIIGSLLSFGWLASFGRLLEFASAVAFIAPTWARIKPFAG